MSFQKGGVGPEFCLQMIAITDNWIRTAVRHSVLVSGIILIAQTPEWHDTSVYKLLMYENVCGHQSRTKERITKEKQIQEQILLQREKEISQSI